ncbi:MAG TPA: hypothetical protein VMM36_09680 [Opitutaceae bacterium]|nr:hypothetical protein [Opitutaceae bacterium]
MNAPFRQTFAIPAACSPVNEMLAAVMRSFGENPAKPGDNRTADHGTRLRPLGFGVASLSRIESPKSKIPESNFCNLKSESQVSNPQSAIRTPQF